MAERILSPRSAVEEAPLEASLRPKRLAEFVGQESLKGNLQIAVAAAVGRGEPLDHLLLHGPPGLGKTTLAHIVAAEMGVNIKVTSGAAIERQGDLASTLTHLKKGDILFIDEIHRLPRTVEEFLYPVLEEFTMYWVSGKGTTATPLRLAVEPFTLIGATTRMALLTGPLRSRFGIVFRFDFYSQDAIEHIVKRSAGILGARIDAQGVKELAQRARGTPRVANRLLKRVRDYAEVMADGTITGPVALEALRRLEVDEKGLDETDHKILKSIIEKFEGGPVGLDTVGASISEESDTIADVYEPYLIQLGFLSRTARGRIATRLAYEHLGLPPKDTGKPEAPQGQLWEERRQ